MGEHSADVAAGFVEVAPWLLDIAAAALVADVAAGYSELQQLLLCFGS